MRYLLGIFVTAVLTAGALRHLLHVQAGFSREEIRVGVLITVAVFIVLTVAFMRRRHRP
jgi:hypothetical protein